MSRLKFLIEGFKNFNEIGTVTRSGPAMCKKMVSYLNEDSRYIIELGAGDGVITPYILEKMPANGMLLSFEINESLFEQLKRIDDPRLIPINDSAENMDKYLDKYDIEYVDAVVSAIPYLVLPKDVAQRILDKCKQRLKKGRPYTQVHYAKGLTDFYRKVFGNLTVHFILYNVPPAYVFYCEKE